MTSECFLHMNTSHHFANTPPPGLRTPAPPPPSSVFLPSISILFSPLSTLNIAARLIVSAQSCLTLNDPRDCSFQPPLSMEFSRQEYWSGLPFPTLGDHPNPGLNLCLLHWQVDSLPRSQLGSPGLTVLEDNLVLLLPD